MTEKVNEIKNTQNANSSGDENYKMVSPYFE